MAMNKFWFEINEPMEHEKQGLNHIKDTLPDHLPYVAWSTFEFIDSQGTINEVDLLLLTPYGFYHIELKNYEGLISADGYNWVLTRGTHRTVRDNPRILTDRKSKRLVSLLRHELRKSRGVPYLHSKVFVHHPTAKIRLPDHLAQGVHTRDEMIGVLTSPDDRGTRISDQQAREIMRAMTRLGIRERAKKADGEAVTHKELRDHRLETLLGEGDHWQEWLGKRRHMSGHNRIRLYPWKVTQMSRDALSETVRRTFLLLDGLDHPCLLKPLNMEIAEQGPALIYEHFPDEIRLDHFISEKGAALDNTTRLHLIQTLIDTLAYAHENQLIHRALAPSSILLLNPDSPTPRLKITNWEAARRHIHHPEGTATTGTSHVEGLQDSHDLIYLAPEIHGDEEPDPDLDIFSLGVIIYHLFTGEPPAATVADRDAKLQEDEGLSLSRVLDGVSPDLQDLVQFCTAGRGLRYTIEDLRDNLIKVEDALTRPDENTFAAPNQAKTGDLLDGGFRVLKRLGRGASAVVFLVERHGEEHVLKVADPIKHNDRLIAEGKLLDKLRHPRFVTCHGTVHVGEHMGLQLEYCHKGILSEYLKEQGRLSDALLYRFGEHLLEALTYLESEGMEHRDFKPENIGISEVKKKGALCLKVFDFSLADISPDELKAGTRAYMDPYLGRGKRKRYDRHAENYSVALNLFKMATGTLPRRADNTTPAIDGELFPPNHREDLVAYFSRALAPEVDDRFTGAEQMRSAWKQIFEENLLHDRATQEAPPLPAQAKTADDRTLLPESPLTELSLTPLALQTLSDMGLTVVADMVALPLQTLQRLRGTPRRVRRDLITTHKILSKRFPDVKRPAEESLPGLDALVPRLVPAGAQAPVVRAFLGLDREAEAIVADNIWPGPADLARRFRLSRVEVENLLNSARARWDKNTRLRLLTQVRNHIAELLKELHGIATADLLCKGLLTRLGSRQDGHIRERWALATLRAAGELEGDKEQPRWIEQRRGRRVILALDDDAGRLGRAAIAYAAALGETADRLAKTEPLPGPGTVKEQLKAVAPPKDLPPLPEARVLQLATACANRAALSGTGELYPSGMSARRALRLARGSLQGFREIRMEQLQRRVRERYPEAQPLSRSYRELVDLLNQEGVNCVWDGTLFDMAGGISFKNTATGASRLTSRAPIWRPRQTEGYTLQYRLEHTLERQGYLVLVAPGNLYRNALDRLQHLPVDILDGDRVIIEALHTHLPPGAPWSTPLQADNHPKDSPAWEKLKHKLINPARDTIRAKLLSTTRTPLLVNLGLFVRYDLLDIVTRLSNRCGQPDGPPGLLVLIPGEQSRETPVLDGSVLPVVTENNWAVVGEEWLKLSPNTLHPEQP